MPSTALNLELYLIDRFDPISNQNLDAFEATHQITLPATYRAFLKRYNGGHFKDFVCLQTLDPLPPDSLRGVHAFFAWIPAWRITPTLPFMAG